MEKFNCSTGRTISYFNETSKGVINLIIPGVKKYNRIKRMRINVPNKFEVLTPKLGPVMSWCYLTQELGRFTDVDETSFNVAIEEILELLRHHKLDKRSFNIISYSQGGMLAMQLCHILKVNKCVIINSFKPKFVTINKDVEYFVSGSAHDEILDHKLNLATLDEFCDIPGATIKIDSYRHLLLPEKLKFMQELLID